MKTLPSKRLLLLAALVAVTLASCESDAPPESAGRSDSNRVADAPRPDSAKPGAKPLPVQEEAGPALTETNTSFYLLRMKDSGKARLKAMTPEMRTIVYKLNRRDAANMGRADSLVIPKEGSPTDINAYSPYPAEIPGLAEVRKIVFFSYPLQAFGAYENGRLVRWGPTSMGKKSTPTPTGLFFSNWKAKETISTVNDEWKLKWNFNISNKGGVGWHEYAMPGYPASHSCLRLFTDDAQWLYSWADQWKLANSNTIVAYGTPTIVFGKYGWGQLRPWMRLLESNESNVLTVDDLEKEYSGYLAEILEKQKTRDGLATTTASAADTTTLK